MQFDQLSPPEQQAVNDTLRPMAEHAGRVMTAFSALDLATSGNAWAYVKAAIQQLDDAAFVPNTNKLPQALTVFTGAQLKGLIALCDGLKALMSADARALCVDIAGPLACSGKA